MTPELVAALKKLDAVIENLDLKRRHHLDLMSALRLIEQTLLAYKEEIERLKKAEAKNE